MRIKKSLLIGAIVIMLSMYLITGCVSIYNSNKQWTAQDAVLAIQNKGLIMKDIHRPSSNDILPEVNSNDILIFSIDNGSDYGLGYILSLNSSEEASKAEEEFTIGIKQNNNFPRKLFAHDNLYIELFGRIPETELHKYEEAIRSLGK